MMTWVRAGLVLLALSGITVGATAVLSSAAAIQLTPLSLQPNAKARQPSLPGRADSVLTLVVAAAPFRATRRPAAKQYNPEDTAPSEAPAQPAPPRPALALTGVVWGTPPAAVIEGLPGSDGPRVVAQGDRIGDLTVKRIGMQEVVILGADTTWTLTVREPWR